MENQNPYKRTTPNSFPGEDILDVARKASLRDLRRARHLVNEDPGIMGGCPVFHGTRIPVHSVAVMLEKGDTVEGLLEGYPRLTAEMIRLAPIYANSYPLQKSARAQHWSDKPPIYEGRRKLSSISLIS